MTYKRLYEDALFKLEHNKITLGEFEEMIKPLEREIEQEPTIRNCFGCKYFKDNHMPSVTPQEPFKPMVKIDLDYVIKQKYIEREVLDKIRAEIEPKCDRINSLASVLPYTAHREIQELLCEIMDLCKAESEDKE